MNRAKRRRFDCLPISTNSEATSSRRRAAWSGSSRSVSGTHYRHGKRPRRACIAYRPCGHILNHIQQGVTMTEDDARARIQSAIDQYGPHAGMAIDLVINETRSDLGIETANELIDEFDLELLYNIPPSEPDGSGSGA